MGEEGGGGGGGEGVETVRENERREKECEKVRGSMCSCTLISGSIRNRCSSWCTLAS